MTLFQLSQQANGHQNAKHLEQRFTNSNHVVVVYVGEEQVTVSLTFNSANITQEGVPPLFAILEGKRRCLLISLNYMQKLEIKKLTAPSLKQKDFTF